MNRFGAKDAENFNPASCEAMVADLGTAFLCGFAGIENRSTEALQASCIEGWSRVFKQDNRILLRAASAAQRAADYIRGKLVRQDAASESQPEPVSLSA